MSKVGALLSKMEATTTQGSFSMDHAKQLFEANKGRVGKTFMLGDKEIDNSVVLATFSAGTTVAFKDGDKVSITVYNGISKSESILVLTAAESKVLKSFL